MTLNELQDKIKNLNDYTDKQFYISIGADDCAIVRYNDCGEIEKCTDEEKVETIIDEICELNNVIDELSNSEINKLNIWWLT